MIWQPRWIYCLVWRFCSDEFSARYYWNCIDGALDSIQFLLIGWNLIGSMNACSCQTIERNIDWISKLWPFSGYFVEISKRIYLLMKRSVSLQSLQNLLQFIENSLFLHLWTETFWIFEFFFLNFLVELKMIQYDDFVQNYQNLNEIHFKVDWNPNLYLPMINYHIYTIF